MFSLFKKLGANRNLLKNLILRDIKHRYVGSIAGFLWSVIHPIVLLVSYTFISSIVFRQRMSQEFGTDSFAIFLPFFQLEATPCRAYTPRGLLPYE